MRRGSSLQKCKVYIVECFHSIFSAYIWICLSSHCRLSEFSIVCMHDGWVEIEFVFSCCVMLGIGSMMKPAWKSSQAESLKKAPLCAETLEKLCMTELNIVNIIIQTTKNVSVRVKVSNFISNIMIISLYVSTLQWCLHQEVHVTLDTDTTISNSQMKMQIFEMRMLWKTRSYYLPFLRAIFLIWGLNSFQHWFISNPFSKFINSFGFIALM